MGEAKGLIITGIVTLLILVGGIFLLSKGNNGAVTKNQTPISSEILVNSASHQTNPGAPITIVEFGDYRCPACEQAYPTTKKLIADYGNKINFVFRNYAFLPDSQLNSTPTASTLAANAAECSADEGKFWEMHDYLYSNQPPETDIKMYNINDLTKGAVSVGVDEAKFKACLTNKTDNDRVQKDYADGQLAKITGTPSFFVNGIALPGVPTYDQFKSLIDQLLSQK